MSMSGYEIRWQVLAKATDLLVEQVHSRQDIERIRAKREKRSPRTELFPTFGDISDLATQMLLFVNDKDKGTSNNSAE